MSLRSRFSNLFRRDRVTREIDEELQAHLDEAIAHGRDPEQARREFGSTLQLRESSRDLRVIPWLDSLRADVVFGWRQLNKRRTVSLAAILSLALAVGATTASFRLVDAILLRPLPIADPGRVFVLANISADRDGRPEARDDFDYPTFRHYREIVADRADLMLVGNSSRQEVVVAPATEPEPAYRQFFSGNVFGNFGLQPALGRLLTPEDDLTPGAHAVAVLSHDYWARRFNRDPGVIGKTFRYGGARFEIVGVGPQGFTGTEPGIVTDLFVPSMMNAQALNSPGWSWFRIWARPKPGVAVEQIRQPIQAALIHERRERVKSLPPDTPKRVIDSYLSETVQFSPAGAGVSNTQKEYRRPLWILAVLVALVLLVACANVGNLQAAQATSRAREMALRVSIGAGKRRLIQLVLVESALLAFFAAVLGALFSWWSAPLVVSMLAPPEDPVRLILAADWRALGFGTALTVLVTLGFGLAPALRASSVKPVSALKGGGERSARGGVMHSLIVAQMAFSILVLLVAGLFVTTFQRLTARQLGFEHARVVAMDVVSGGKKQPRVFWEQAADRLRQTPGVESVAFAGWTLLSGNHWTSHVRVATREPDVSRPSMLGVSSGFFETLRIELLDGRDFRPDDVPPSAETGSRAGAGIVNQAFARAYFDGQNPVGRTIELRSAPVPLQIVGYVRDAVYSNVREVIRPTIYVPTEERNGGTFIIRTAGDPRALAPVLRRDGAQAGPGIRVRNLAFQSAMVRKQMIRERLLATLSFFFAVVVLVLAAIGLYGVLNYAVIQQRREIGIRLALGARSADVVRRVTSGMLARVALGAALGIAGGLAGSRVLESLLFEVKTSDLGMLAIPLLTLLTAAILAALPPTIRAVRIDPARTLRSE